MARHSHSDRGKLGALALIILLSLFPLQGQRGKGYEPGYIITREGDTLTGWVKDRGPEPFTELYTRIRFREDGRRRGKEKLGALEIRGYEVGGRLYDAVPLREESEFFRVRHVMDAQGPWVFLRVIRREGPLTYYHREYIHDDNFYLDFYPLFHREGSREMVRVTQGILGLKRKHLAEYFSDCPALVEALETKTLREAEAVFAFYLQHCGE